MYPPCESLAQPRFEHLHREVEQITDVFVHRYETLEARVSNLQVDVNKRELDLDVQMLTELQKVMMPTMQAAFSPLVEHMCLRMAKLEQRADAGDSTSVVSTRAGKELSPARGWMTIACFLFMMLLFCACVNFMGDTGFCNVDSKLSLCLASLTFLHRWPQLSFLYRRSASGLARARMFDEFSSLLGRPHRYANVLFGLSA